MPNGDDRRELALQFVQGEWNGEKRMFRRNIVIVGYRLVGGLTDDETIDLIVDAVPGSSVEYKSPHRPWFSLQIPDTADVEQTARMLRARPEGDVEYAEPDFKLVGAAGVAEGACGNNWTSKQWGVKNVDAPSAWGLERGKSHVLVAILDSGISMEEKGGSWFLYHEDLDSGRFHLGTNVIKEYDDAEPNAPRDTNGHGTYITGIIAATVNDDEHLEVGVHGLNRESPVYICRILQGLTYTDTETAVSLVLRGLEEVVSFAGDLADSSDAFRLYGRVVINLSIVAVDSEDPPETLRAIVADLADRDDILVVCAMGNKSDQGQWYPARFSLEIPDTVVAVGGTMLSGTTEQIYDQSLTGEHVSMVAPGHEIWTTQIPRTVDGNDLCYAFANGTSYATPFVVAIASLVWSKCPNATSADVVACLKCACENPTSGELDPTEWGAGRINAYFAVPDVYTDVQNIELADVAPGEAVSAAITLKVKSCMELTFNVEVEVDETHSDANTLFRSAGEVSYTPDGSDPGAYQEFRDITVTYRGTSHGSLGVGRAVITCDKFDDDWKLEVTVTANTSVGRSHIVLVADKSGSMGLPSGIDESTRMEALGFAAGVMIDNLQVDNAMEIVSFDEDAHDEVGLTVIPQDENAAVETKAGLTGAVNGLVPGGLTSIADGVEKAQSKFPVGSDYDNEAIIVLTDGKETAEKYLDTFTALPDRNVYAIAMATESSVDIGNLTTLTSGGYTLLTGALLDENRYKIAKYFLQILADVDNSDIVLDPVGRVRPGRTYRIPFRVARADSRVDVVLMMPARKLIRLRVEMPEGGIIGEREGIVFSAGANVSSYRIELPLNLRDHSVHEGMWHALLDVDGDDYASYLKDDQEPARTREQAGRHGILYSLMVRARTDLRMTAQLQQHGFAPGDTMNLRAVLTYKSLPLPRRISMRVFIRYPDGTERVVNLTYRSPGIYEATETLPIAGVYECRFVATGTTPRGDSFTREQIRTAAVGTPSTLLPVWIARGPMLPPVTPPGA